MSDPNDQAPETNLPVGATYVSGTTSGTYKIVIDPNDPQYQAYIAKIVIDPNDPQYQAYIASNPAAQATATISGMGQQMVTGVGADGQLYFDFATGHNTIVTPEPTKAMAFCDECKGTGQYVGLTAVELCKACGGAGKV